MVLGGKGFQTWLGHEGGGLMNGISAFVKETSKNYYVPSAM